MPSAERFNHQRPVAAGVEREPSRLDPRLSESLTRLERAVAQIQDSETFRRYLDAQAKFHHYSWGNVLLIVSQRPDATQVAGYRTWQALGRQVRRGESGIRIMVPMRRRVERDDEEDSESETRLFFGTGHVWDISQTDGPALPSLAVPILEGEAGAKLYSQLESLAHAEGVSVQLAHDLGGERMGYYDPQVRQIVLRRAPQRQMTKTLAHELAHHYGGATQSTPEEETIAEATAYVVCARFGLDTGERSFPYVAGWSKEPRVFKAALTRIQELSCLMIGKLDPTALPNHGWQSTPTQETLTASGESPLPSARIDQLVSVLEPTPDSLLD